MNLRMWLFPIALVILALGVAVAFFQSGTTPSPPVQLPASEPEITIATPAPSPAAPTQPVPNVPLPQPEPAAQPRVSTSLPPPQRQDNKAIHSDEPQPVPESVARVALSYVGMDPDAEAVWIAAINDPRTSPKARQNLIEDLNEDGFPDPHHVTSDDLPLIVSRLALIEELAPDAADEVNAAAFAEAYEDLANMFLRVTAQ